MLFLKLACPYFIVEIGSEAERYMEWYFMYKLVGLVQNFIKIGLI